MVFLVDWWGRSQVHVAMLLVSAGRAGYIVLTKAILTGGVDPFLFSTYRDGIGCLTLFFYAAVYEREHWTKITFEVAGFIVALAITGMYLEHTFFLFGLKYTNAIFASIVMNCVPVWTFLIAVIFRVEEISFDRRDGQAKVLGIFFCVTGASVLTLYKGPVIFGDPNPVSPPSHGVNSPFAGPLFSALRGWGIDSWRLGALLLLSCTICVSSVINIQASALKRFPAPFTMTALTALLGTAMFALTTYFRLEEPSAWILAPGPDLYAAIYAGAVASGFCLLLSAWANQQSGPVLVASYAPTTPMFSSLLGTIFLHSALFMGNLLGASSVLIGLFLVIWGTRESLRSKALSLQIPTHGKQLSADITKPASLLVEPLLLWLSRRTGLQSIKRVSVGFYSMHPGWVDTGGVQKSMPGFYAKFQESLQSLDEGAGTIAWLCLQPRTKLQSGEFYFNRKSGTKKSG